MYVDGKPVIILCSELDPRANASHADRQDATEEGAVALAITLVREGTDFDVVQRSWKGTSASTTSSRLRRAALPSMERHAWRYRVSLKKTT
jgi:hypothetical protein